MTNTEMLRNRLMASVIDAAVGDKREHKESLRRSEWSPTFERLMRNRLLVGRYRYGRMDRDHDTDYDRVASILHRLTEYQQHGNLEHLVDIANLCMMEFEHATHDQAHFHASDDADHVRKRTQYEGEQL